MNDTRFNLVLPSDLKSAVGIAATQKDLSLGAYTRRALRLCMSYDLKDLGDPTQPSGVVKAVLAGALTGRATTP